MIALTQMAVVVVRLRNLLIRGETSSCDSFMSAWIRFAALSFGSPYSKFLMLSHNFMRL